MSNDRIRNCARARDGCARQHFNKYSIFRIEFKLMMHNHHFFPPILRQYNCIFFIHLHFTPSRFFNIYGHLFFSFFSRFFSLHFSKLELLIFEIFQFPYLLL